MILAPPDNSFSTGAPQLESLPHKRRSGTTKEKALGRDACANRSALPRAHARPGGKGKARRLAPGKRHRHGGHLCNTPIGHRSELVVTLPLPYAPRLSTARAIFMMASMIVTHTTNSHGEVRLYLGGAASIEFWIEPIPDEVGWTLHKDDGLGAVPLDPAEQMECAKFLFAQLAERLGIELEHIFYVPFEVIASLHDANPRERRRVATPTRRLAEHGYMATAPSITRPQADFRAHVRDASARYTRSR